MDTLTRYILRQLALATLSVAAVLTLAVWLSQSLRFLDYIVNRGLAISDFLLLAGLMLPEFLGVVLPVAAFAALLFVYNRLAGDSELAVVGAAGVSPLRIARPGLLLALAATLLGYAISLYLLPTSHRAFKDFQFEIRHDYAALLLEEGVFNSVSEDLTVYVRARGADGALRGLLIHDRRDGGTPVTMIARRGALVKGAQGPRVVLADGSRQVLDPDSGHLSMLYFDRYTLDLAGVATAPQTRWRQPRERYLGQLLVPGPGPNDQRFAGELVAEGHRRLAFPLHALAFVGIGLAAVLGGRPDRTRRQRRLLAAVLAVSALQLAQLALVDLSAQSSALLPGLYALPGAALLGALLWLARDRLPSRRASERAGAAMLRPRAAGVAP